MGRPPRIEEPNHFLAEHFDGDPTKRWHGFYVLHMPGVTGLHAPSMVKVFPAPEGSDSPYWGWEDIKTPGLYSMIQPSHMQLEMCFYGLDAAEKAGQGRRVQLLVEEVLPWERVSAEALKTFSGKGVGMSKTRGYIPDTVLLFRRGAPNQPEGTPCFVVRTGGTETAMRNAQSWVRNNRWGHRKHPEPDIVPVEAPNEPRGGFKLVGAEQRGEGGRAWKVITPDGDLVDMREDVFLPILLKKGLPASGIIKAKFQWCQNGSQLRLEEVGSAQHKQYQTEVESTTARERKKREQKLHRPKYLGLRELEVGLVYEFEQYGAKYKMVYLGRLRYEGKIKTAWIAPSAIPRLKTGHAQVAEMRSGSQARRLVKGLTPQVRQQLLNNLPEKRALLACWTNGSGAVLPDGGYSYDRDRTPLEVDWL
jgi:hypothetical protein